jgi:hypothetical protein
MGSPTRLWRLVTVIRPVTHRQRSSRLSLLASPVYGLYLVTLALVSTECLGHASCELPLQGNTNKKAGEFLSLCRDTEFPIELRNIRFHNVFIITTRSRSTFSHLSSTIFPCRDKALTRFLSSLPSRSPFPSCAR